MGVAIILIFISLEFIAPLWSSFFVLFYGFSFWCYCKQQNRLKNSTNISSIDEIHLHKLDNETLKNNPMERKEWTILTSQMGIIKNGMHW